MGSYGDAKIRVALMAYAMDGRPAKGSALYARRIVEQLLQRPELDVTLVHYERNDDPIYRRATEVVMPRVKFPFGARFLSQALFFWRFRRQPFDVLHWFQPRLYPFFWLAPARRLVATVHGAGDITAPAAFDLGREVFVWVLRRFGNKLHLALADSNFARDEVVQHYGLDASLVEAAYIGGGESFRPIPKAEAEQVAQRYGLELPYVLCVGRLQPHKNIPRLVRAYGRLRQSTDRAERLVLVGLPAGDERNVAAAVAACPAGADVQLVSFVNDADLNALYSAASLFVFPSLNEGFGLPVVEAMSAGVPVVTSSTTSLPEVAGDAALLVDPTDEQALADAMAAVLSDSQLAGGMVSRGLAQSARFTWHAAASHLVASYRRLLNGDESGS